MITVGELFAGIGGIGFGLEQTGGFQTKWQVERDSYALKVLEKHWPDVTRWDDVRTFPPPPVSPWFMHDWKAIWGVDLICGGFPCQDISYAGKGAGLSGARSGLFYEVIRVARCLRPRWLLLENVAALLSRGLGTVLAELSSIGYVGEWHCIPAAAVGAPHRRDRIFILAHPVRERFNERTTSQTGNTQRPANHNIEDRENGNVPTANMGSIMADANGAGLPKPTCGQLAIVSGEAKAQERRQSSGRVPEAGNHWSTEPDVGGTIDGFSSWLERSGLTNESHKRILAYVTSTQEKSHADATEKRTKEVMRTLRDSTEKEGLQWEARGLVSVPSEAVLFAYLCQLEKDTAHKTRLFVAGEETSKKGVRSVPTGDEPERTPRRSRDKQQRRGEHPDALQALSRLLALDSEKAWTQYRRENASAINHWESGIARVATAVPARVDRLRCLGNAVVPQVAEYIGRHILKHETRR